MRRSRTLQPETTMAQETLTQQATHVTPGIELRAAFKPSYETILTPAALAFVAGLERGAERRRA